jgi:hypothetical protein
MTDTDDIDNEPSALYLLIRKRFHDEPSIENYNDVLINFQKYYILSMLNKSYDSYVFKKLNDLQIGQSYK